MPAFAAISPLQLARLMGLPDAPVILDVRRDEDFAADPRLIPTARHHAAQAVAAPPGSRAVVLCQHGHARSEGAAAMLRIQGVEAEILEGGFHAWAEAGLPLTAADRLPASPFWVTRQRPKIDRIACPWLIRRFIDPEAQFLFVAPAEVEGVARQFDATPFDIEGVTFSHQGELCSFDTMLDLFGLQIQPLLRMALVIRGADTNRHDLAPQAAGLLAISVGLSRQYRDDLGQLEAGMAIYDALYRWARDGFEEGHDWPAGRSA